MKYKIKCPIMTNGESIEDNRYKLTVFGEGKDGDLSLTPSDMNFGIIMVNFVKSGKFYLTNNSETTFYASLILEIEDPIENKEELLSYFLSDFKEGLISAKSKKEVLISFNPKNICDFKLKITALVRSNLDNPEETYICCKSFSYLYVKSNYPLLKIISVKNNTLSLASLWEKFDI